MSDQKRVVIVGGHGKVALLAAGDLARAGYAVTSLIRNPEQRADVRAAGATPQVLDIEAASVAELTQAFTGAAAVVFSAGAGGGDPARTHAVDYVGALHAMEAAAAAGVTRFVMVSYVTAATDVDRLDPSDSFYAYAKAKHDADAHLRETGLDYTILGPGALTTDPASGAIRVVPDSEAADGRGSGEGGTTSRANVAAVIAHVIQHAAARRQTVNFFDGETPIAQALG